ncbi:uncharacterized protein MYCFIDRAFT_178257 [Pseudocercospora fijiensis CIRAD86]|uniref:Uncharacterized protein n=1 Tax=Pseudocercospora fijiensis (strain CIRAD86) TaxID=383855 RepID=M3A507_PSEFD|nr:uncharacterized protein MYCFIDRAFT_178257 [Pseudocercospora fijiensis CIRAD86]EME79686.1 hypothetical protein MYCFIDRAFT_178257 [Pseudocercospora fijiensis CIRAD86]
MALEMAVELATEASPNLNLSRLNGGSGQGPVFFAAKFDANGLESNCHRPSDADNQIQPSSRQADDDDERPSHPQHAILHAALWRDLVNGRVTDDQSRPLSTKTRASTGNAPAASRSRHHLRSSCRFVPAEVTCNNGLSPLRYRIRQKMAANTLNLLHPSISFTS